LQNVKKNAKLKKAMDKQPNQPKYIDIHSHVLPGLDDGPQDFESAVAILRLAAENRIGTIICTPHFKDGISDGSSIGDLVKKLNERIASEGLGIKLHSGNEIFYTETALSALEEGRAKTLAASDFVLVEFTPWVTWGELQEGLFNLKSSGYRPILAHSERYECLNKGREERSRVSILRDYGILIQLNSEAVMEKTKFTKYLLKNELADFVATDAHSNRRRGPYLKACGAYLDKKYGREYTNRLLYENARNILEWRTETT
jgi:protein-tyrosine phosphatase